MIRAAHGKPGDGMTYVEADQLSTPSARPGLRLLCLLVQTRNGETRSLPVHTLRPMPPRLCAADSHAANGLRRWNLEASGLGVDSGTGLYLREAHATRPPREVVERYLRLGQAHALRADSRAVRTGGVIANEAHVCIAARAADGFGRALTIGGELYGYVTFNEGARIFAPLDGGEPSWHRTLGDLRRYVTNRFQSQQWPDRSRAALPACPNTPHRSDKRKHGRSAPLTLHEQKQPPLVSVGQLHRPALPSPRRQEWDDKGKALGVKPTIKFIHSGEFTNPTKSNIDQQQTN